MYSEKCFDEAVEQVRRERSQFNTNGREPWRFDYRNPDFVVNPVAESIIKATGARINHVRPDRGSSYAVDEDTIFLPRREEFDTANLAYQINFHELIHWTGHPSRLNRINHHWRPHPMTYALEEITAELGAAMIAKTLGIWTPEFSSTYIRQYMSDLRPRTNDFINDFIAMLDPKPHWDEHSFQRATIQAKEAARFILNKSTTEQTRQTHREFLGV